MKDGRATSTRAQIVQAARRLFYTKGFEATSLGDLAETIGIPKGNFYYHFKTKDEVLLAVLDARRLDIEAALSRFRNELKTPQRRLLRLVDMLASESDDLCRYGCPTGSLLVELGKDHRKLLLEARTTMELFVGFATEQFIALHFPPQKARHLGERLLARLQGAVLLAQTYEDPLLLRREAQDIVRSLKMTRRLGTQVRKRGEVRKTD